MKLSDIREKPTPELRALELELRRELFKMKMDHATQQLDQTHKLKRHKKTISRILTVIREREVVEEGKEKEA